MIPPFLRFIGERTSRISGGLRKPPKGAKTITWFLKIRNPNIEFL